MSAGVIVDPIIIEGVEMGSSDRDEIPRPIISSGISGVEISFSDGSSSVITDRSGNWSKSGITGAVTVTPVHDDWSFDPPELLVDGPSESVDFTGTEIGIDYTISGLVTENASAVGIEGVNIAFSDGSSSVTTNADGEWSKSGLSGAVTVTPVHDDWSFDPPELLVHGPSESVDFTGTESGISFAGGDGTESDPYQVATAAQLNEIRNHLSSYFVQTADIDLSGYTEGDGWEPIGPVFWGSLDGGANHTISGLFIDRTGDKTGLFANSGGDILNVKLVDVDITADGDWVGALAGSNSGTITNCTADGTVTQTGDATATVGGLVGSNSGTITGSESNAAVSGAFTVGGLSGTNRGTIADSFATGPVAGPQTGDLGNRVGGLVGLNENGLISDSYATGLVTIDAAGYAVGGLVG
ncbi:MAG: hypothetical protein EA404_08845, partial [Spirochaetaceae bacterium]